MFKKSYDDLTAIERDNVAKRKVMEYAKQRMEGQITQGYKNQNIENAENAELESKKRLFTEIFNAYNIALNQTYDYFNYLPGRGKKGEIVKFIGGEVVARFYDQVAKLELMNEQLIELNKDILKDIPVNDDFLKKIKKMNKKLETNINNYNDLFEPTINEDGNRITDFDDDNMKNVNETDIDARIYNIYEEMVELYNKNNNIINYLNMTVRSGEGRSKYLIDTTEYIIPSKYL